MVAITRVGTARPSWTCDAHPSLGPDEDAFTLAAAAAEAALRGRPERTTGLSIELVGPLPALADWAVPALLGVASPASRSPSVGDALARHVTLGRDEGVLVVEVRGIPPDSTTPGPSAIAILLRDAPGWDLRPAHPSTTETAPGTIEQLERLRAPVEDGPVRIGGYPGYEASKNPSIPWVDSYVREAGTSSLTLARSTRDRLSALSLEQVSEGAYVPRPRYLESIPSTWRFCAERCSACSHLSFPARGACPTCGSHASLSLEALPLDGGQVVALTTIGKGGQPTEFDPLVEAVGSYQVAILELAPGCRATVQVADTTPGALKIGDRVSTRLRRLYPMEGEWRYGRKAIPFQQGGAEV